MSYLGDAVADRSLVSNSLHVTDIVNEVEGNVAILMRRKDMMTR